MLFSLRLEQTQHGHEDKSEPELNFSPQPVIFSVY